MSDTSDAGHDRWFRVRGVLALPGLALPLTAAGLTRHTLAVLAPFVVLGLLAALPAARNHRRPIAWIYGIGCLLLTVAAHRVLGVVDASAAWRAVATAAALAMLVEFDRRKRASGPPVPTDFLRDLLVLALGAVLIRAGMLGMFTNRGVTSALLVLLPLLHFRPRLGGTLLWLVPAMSMIYAWHGFMNGARYEAQVDAQPPAGIEVTALVHGDPVGMPGARFFRPGECPGTRDAYYMGEGSRTYRLEADGSETVFIDGLESMQTLIERCAEDEIVVGSFEGKLLRFARLGTGETIQDLALPSHPATMMLSDDGGTIYVSTSMPAGLLKIDVKTRSITGVFDHYFEIDPRFSGMVNLYQVGDRIVSAYSSWYLIDMRPGELISVNLDLEDLRVHDRYLGAWGFLARDPRRQGGLFLKAYGGNMGVLATGANGALSHFTEAPDGDFYMTTLPDAGLLVLNHWTTAELLAICLSDPDRRFSLRTGGMGRMLHGRGHELFTPTASGYLTIRFPPDICPGGTG